MQWPNSGGEGLHPIGKLLGEIAWLLDAPDADNRLLTVKFCDESAEVSFALQADLSVLDGAPNLANSSVSTIKSDRQTFPKDHVAKMLRHGDWGWVRSFSISQAARHFRSFPYKDRDKTI